MTEIFLVFSALIGLAIGSFINCLVWRLHKDETVMGRSYCPHCRHQLAWFDNIPLLSFFMLRGRCRYCKKPISWQYPAVEAIVAILFSWSFFNNCRESLFPLLLARDWLLIVVLAVVFVYDYRWQMVPMKVIWPASALFFFFSLLLGYNWLTIVISAASAVAFFGLQHVLTKGRGLGEGDVWLGLMIALALPGLDRLLLVVLITYILGSLVGIILIMRRKKRGHSKIALGPFLALGALSALFWGGEIISWYLGLFR